MTPEDLEYSKPNVYIKYYINGLIPAKIYYDKHCEKYWGYIERSIDIVVQQDIDNLQIAYNNLQRDLKELNK